MELRKKEAFGATFLTLVNDVGMELTVCNAGASLFRLIYQGRFMSNGPKDEEVFLASPIKSGKTVGPIGGRVKEGKIMVDGKPSIIPPNHGKHACHSSVAGIDKIPFEFEVKEENDGMSVVFSHFYKANEYYPCDVEMKVTYSLKKDEPTIVIKEEATPSKDAPINLVNHSYFALGEKDILEGKLYIDASSVADYDEELAVLGTKEVNEVFDFRELRPIKRYLFDPSIKEPPLGGYDHCFYFDRSQKGKPDLIYQQKDYTLELYTNAPAVQVYTTNKIKSNVEMDSGEMLKSYAGLAIEPCSYQGNILAMTVKANKTKTVETVYRFIDRHALEKEEGPEKALASLIAFYCLHGLIKEGDETYFHNMALHHLRLQKPYDGPLDLLHLEALNVPDEMLSPIKKRFKEIGYGEEEAERELAFLLGMLGPTPSEVEERFNLLYAESPKKATEYLYALSLNMGYVAKEKVDENIVEDASFPDGPSLTISINLSKPEKDNREIAKVLERKDTGYPKCVLCYENIGFGGSPTHPPRGYIRFAPVTLNGEKWYLQFSPYGYFKRHCIVFSKDHVPMAVNEGTFRALFDFVDLFPHYFIGSNSDLPRVGGSILNHEHFQGGEEVLPLLKAPFKEEIPLKEEGVRLFVVSFYDTCLCLEGKDREKIISLAEKIRSSWRGYKDEENGIIPESGGKPHNTVTPIVRKIGRTYRLYLILRNNRVDEAYPDGIFHAHPEYHHIKKEGIGLIEASGLFVLPARLRRQAKILEEGVVNDVSFDQLKAEHPDLSGFLDMFDALNRGETKESYMAEVCRKILGNVAVYKDDEKGRKGLARFLKEVVQ